MPLPRPQAVIFDWDDTIVNTWRIIHAAINVTLEHMDHAPWSEDEARQHIGPPARVLFSGLFGEDKWQEADAVFIKAYADSIDGNIRVHDSAEDILKFFQQAQVPMVCLSSKRGSVLRREVTHLGFDQYFQNIIGAGDAPQDKPDRAAVLHVLQPTGIAAGQGVWLVGDGATDMICAHGAGLTPVLLETKLPDADKIAATPPAARFKTQADLLAFLHAEFKALPAA